MNVKWTVLVLIVALCGYVPEPTFAEEEEGDVVAPAIIGGTDAAEDAWPWQILLLRYGFFSCGGVILNADTILTAAHCTYGSSTWQNIVVVGTHNRWNFLEWWTRGLQWKTVREIIEHPDYDDGSLEHDVAIMKLRSPIRFNEYIQPMPQLANSSMDFIDKTCYVTGWGEINEPGSSSSILQQLDTPVITNAQCNDGRIKSHTVTDDMICTDSEPRRTCFGDSGGPLQCLIDNVWVHTGLVSWGNFDCRDGPAVYASTAVHRDWILSQM